MEHIGYIIGRNIQIPDYPGLFLVGKYGDTITFQMNADGIIDDYDFYLSYKSNYISLTKTIADGIIYLSFTIPQNFTNTVGKVFIQVLGYTSGDEPGDTVQWSSLTTQLIVANSQPGPVYPESEIPVVHDFAETNHTGFIVGKNIQLPNYLGMLVEGENITETITLKMGRDDVLDDLEYYLVYKNANNLGDTLALNKVVDSNISLSFVVTDYFTAVKGKMEIQVVGYNAGDTPGTDDPVWESFVSTLMIQRALHPEEIQPEIPTIFVTYLAQMLALKQAAEAAKTGAEYAQGKAEDAQTASEYAQGKAEDAQEASEIAQSKAEDAQTASETAQGLAEQAQGLAETAQEKAETAQGKAETAQEKAETAQGKAEDAQELAETAQGLAETAQGKAEDAQTAAETAQGKAEDAQELAETAQGKAEGAQTAAETAQGLAETAQGKAETAQGKAEQAQSASESAKDTSVANANLSSQYARGKKLNGTDVVSGEDGYQDNSKYYKGLAETANTNAQSAKTSAENARDKAEKWAEESEDTPVETGKYSAKHYASKASVSATSASTSASSSEDSAEDSESWAVGKRNGTDVASTDPAYHNNAKYYSGQASDAKTGAQTAQGLAENARDLAQGYASDASNAKTAAQGYATDADNARISSVSETTSPDDGGTNVITFTYKDGTVKTFTVTNGHTGAPFSIYKTYASIAAMNADLANVPEGKFVIITSTVDDPDNAKLYVRGASSFTYVTDLSGAQGIQGPDGQAATITVGSVQTGSAGSSASVTNSGTSSAAVFDFVIPKGDKGDTGSTGSAATISVGTTTTGQAGTSASVTNSGTSSAAVFNFTIPKGDKGDTGSTGAAAGFGTPTASVDANVGTPSVTVTASGADTAKVFDFAFKNLKGAKGDTGSTGATGKGISSIAYKYATTTTQSAPSAESITSDSIPTMSATNKYLWQKETISYTSGSPTVHILLIAVYGDKGDTGSAGAAAGFGTPTASVDANTGTPSVTITASGTNTSKVFDFAFKNLKGAKGDTGSSGSAATVTVGTTTTGQAGTNASVTNSGTSSAVVLNFTIPKGDKGDTGSTGPGVASGGTTGQFLKKKSGTNYDTEWANEQDISGKADKATTLAGYGITDAKIVGGVITLGNDSITPLTSHQSLSAYVQGASSSTDSHVAVFDGTGGKTIKDSGYTIGKSVPSDAVFTDTTYESKSASSGGTAVSLVTTGEKYTWNDKANASETGYSLAVSGTTVTLKNKAGTALSSITTQDTTYSAISNTTIDNTFV